MARIVSTCLLCLILALTSCSDDGASGDTIPREPTEAEMAAFCTRWDEVRNMSRSEYVRELAEVAPTEELRGALERTATREGSLEEDELIDAFLERCDSEE